LESGLDVPQLVRVDLRGLAQEGELLVGIARTGGANAERADERLVLAAKLVDGLEDLGRGGRDFGVVEERLERLARSVVLGHEREDQAIQLDRLVLPPEPGLVDLAEAEPERRLFLLVLGQAHPARDGLAELFPA